MVIFSTMKFVNSIARRFDPWPQWLAAFQLFLMATMIGLTSGWTSPYLAKLSRPDSPLPITEEQASWIASIGSIAMPIGAVFGALIVYFFGSKPAAHLSGMVFIFSWVCFLKSDVLDLIYLSRILSGIGIGTFNCSFPLFIGEISNADIRGALVSFIMQGLMVGYFLGNIMGTYLDIWLFATISLVPNLVFVCSFLSLPQTPHHLVRSNKIKEAAMSIQWYNRNADVESELEALKKFIPTNQTSTFCGALRELTATINRKTLLMINIVYCLAQLSGFGVVSAYMEIILIKAQVTIVAPSTVVISASILGMIFSLVATYTSDKYGRTTMLIISSASTAAGLFIWGLNYQLLELGFDSSNLQWLSLIGVFIFKMSITMGIIPVPPIMKSEMFAPNIKSIAASFTNIISAFFTFIASKSYQPMVDVLSIKYVFWMYALIMVVLGSYTMIFVPETKGKSLADIQVMLASREILNKPNYDENVKTKIDKHIGYSKKENV